MLQCCSADICRWWFKLRCVRGSMEVVATQWRDVVTDPRYPAFVQSIQDNNV